MFDLCFECEKPILEEALQACARMVNPKSPLPILSHILLEAKDGWVSVTATDLDMGITLRVPASITGEGSVACPARLMLDIVSKFPAAPITVEVVQEGRLKLKCGRSKFEITSLPASEYPSLPERKDVTELKIPHRDLKAMVRRVGTAVAASDESRAVMTGILTSVSEGQLVMVATDGRRLAFATHALPDSVSQDQTIIVPGRAMQELARISALTDESLTLRLADNMLFCELKDLKLHCRLLEGNFPDYRRVLPTEFQRFCRISREALLAGLKRMLIVAQERQSPNLIVLDLAGDRLLLSANTPDLGLGQDEIPVIYEGDDLRIAFNGKYMLDVLSALDCEEVQIDLQDDTRSAVLREYGVEGFRYVLMPVRLREAVPEEAQVVGV